MSSHYFYRPGNYLPNYFGYQYLTPEFSNWGNYTVPFAIPPYSSIVPHNYYVRNDADQIPSIVCQKTSDNRFCPLASREIVTNSTGVSQCGIGDRTFTSVSSLAECNFPGSWPVHM
jgi:hypothetical protein